MATLHVRNVPDELYSRIRERAETTNRSLSAEVVILLSEALEGPRISPREVLADIQRRRFFRPAEAGAPDVAEPSRGSGEVSLELVVDASVVVKVFVQEDLSQEADALLQHLDDQPPAWFYVPPHFLSECTNIFWKYIRRFNYPLDAARRDLANLRALPFQILEVPPLLVLDLAAEHDITAYDAGYAALAQHLGVPLVTADERLVRKLKKSSCQIVWLGDLQQLGL